MCRYVPGWGGRGGGGGAERERERERATNKVVGFHIMFFNLVKWVMKTLV